jgi:hypothetical protein
MYNYYDELQLLFSNLLLQLLSIGPQLLDSYRYILHLPSAVTFNKSYKLFTIPFYKLIYNYYLQTTQLHFTITFTKYCCIKLQYYLVNY